MSGKFRSRISENFMVHQFNKSLANDKLFLTPVAKYLLWFVKPFAHLAAIRDRSQMPTTLSSPTN
jgi:hypothetical protein